MKKFLLFFITPLVLMYACSEDELDTYDGRDFIYFAKRVASENNEYWDTLKTFNFYFSPGITDTVFRIEVSTGGPLYEYDRTFFIDIQVGGGAQEGTDFEISREQVVPAGRNKMTIPITLHHTEKLEGNTYSLLITLKESEFFTLDLPQVYHKGDTIQRHKMLLEWKAEVGQPPLYPSFGVGYFGYFSVTKFLAMNEFWGTDPVADWEGTSAYVFNNAANLAVVFANYLNSRIAMGQEYALIDLSAESVKGYMVLDGLYGSHFGIPPTPIPDHFTKVQGWLGQEKEQK